MSDAEAHCCKVGRVASRYAIEPRTDGLVTEWQEGESVRSLADAFNEAVVDAALERADATLAEWSRGPIHDALRTDDVSESEKVEIRRGIEREGVDVEEISSALVSHQTLYRHLTQCLDESKETTRSREERLESARDTIYALQERTQQVTESTMTTLQRAGVTDIGDSDVIVDVRIVCNDCGRSMDVETALTDGCECDQQ